jgi:hypothetical protein
LPLKGKCSNIVYGESLLTIIRFKLEYENQFEIDHLEYFYQINLEIFVLKHKMEFFFVCSNHFLPGFERLAVLPKLEILDLGSNSFDYSIIPSLSRLASLKTLSLAKNYLGWLNTTTGNLLSLDFFPLYL